MMFPTCPSCKSVVALDTSEEIIKDLMNNILPPSADGWGTYEWLQITSMALQVKFKASSTTSKKGLNNFLFPACLPDLEQGREEEQKNPKALKTELCFCFEL